MFNRSSIGSCSFIGCVALLLSGCGDASVPAPERAGTLRSALATVGSDGASYEFPENSLAVIMGPGGGQIVQLHGPEQVLDVPLPVGTFTIDLAFPGDGAMLLDRTIDGVTSPVHVNWVDARPLPFQIAQNSQTDLALHFRADTLGDITFDSGNLALTADVEAGESTQVGRIELESFLSFFSEVYADPNAAYATGLDVAEDEFSSIALVPLNDWRIDPGTVCRDVRVDAGSFSSQGLLNRVAEVTTTGEPLRLCIFDGGDSDVLEVFGSHVGAAPPDQTFLPDDVYFFQLNTTARIGDVFDGITLRQSALSQVSVQTGSFGHTVSQSPGPLAEASAFWTGTVRFRP